MDQTHPASRPEKKSPDANPQDWNNPFTRRSLLMRTGKAGALTILALHGLKVEVLAATPSGSATM